MISQRQIAELAARNMVELLMVEDYSLRVWKPRGKHFTDQILPTLIELAATRTLTQLELTESA